MQDELRKLPPSEVRGPEGDQHLLGARVLDQLEQEAFRELIGKHRVARVSVLALAMVQAQHAFLYERPAKRIRGYDALVAESRTVFLEIEEAVRTLVCRGQLRRSEVPTPRRDETLDERCRRIADLVEIVDEHDGDGYLVSRGLLVRAEKIARRLEGATPYRGKELSAREVRNRVFTLLSAAIDEATRAPSPSPDAPTCASTQRLAA